MNTPPTLTDLFSEWYESLPPDVYGHVQKIQSRLDYLAQNHFSSYEPEQHSSFQSRFESWLSNVDSIESKVTLFRLAGQLIYFGVSEFEALYRHCYRNIVPEWIRSDLQLDVLNPESLEIIYAEIERTWFCPITDSMRINAFYHVNHIAAPRHRPSWSDLNVFASVDKIVEYVEDKGLTRVVLLEDFVGSGKQIEEAALPLMQKMPNVKFVVSPLVVCLKGTRRWLRISKSNANIDYIPCFTIPERCFVKPLKQDGEDAVITRTRKLALSVANRTNPGELSESCFGYGSMGAMFVMYSNCPNNTLPLVHSSTEHWKALFSRSNRS